MCFSRVMTKMREEKCIFGVFYFFIMEKVKMLFRREKSYVKSMKKKVYEQCASVKSVF